MIDCLLSLQTSAVENNEQKKLNNYKLTYCLNKIKTEGNKLVYFDGANGISNQIFLRNYAIVSAILYELGQNDIEA